MDRPFLIGENIYLRPLDLDDIENDYLQWINSEYITKYLDRPFPVTRRDMQEYVDSVLTNKDYIFFAIIEIKTEKHVGNIKIGPINWIHRRTGFGRIISKENWGKSYGAEATFLIIKYIFDQLNLYRIVEHCIVKNYGAVKSNEKAGLNNEGTIKEFVFADGTYQDVAIMGLTQPEYRIKKGTGFFDKFTK